MGTTGNKSETQETPAPAPAFLFATREEAETFARRVRGERSFTNGSLTLSAPDGFVLDPHVRELKVHIGPLRGAIDGEGASVTFRLEVVVEVIPR